MAMQREVSEQEMEQLGGPECLHHWVIEPANGPFSTGICQVCQEAREFRNSIDAVGWVGSKSANGANSPGTTR